ncbi:J domain-containing protein [uncultured Draconibacterium sp.]|uniref:J domain-containing protein n=1 Tax=uncultured Draconibacterium sp. TaxID=1573823 RepID=UPI0029C71EC7|nr:J domain-containing protein [uncultured Draconibacterium sp.]
MNFIDYYKILGIDKKATASDIKKAYRKQARKYHPDLNPKDADAKKNFQQINEANAVLSDPEKRKKYDKYGKDWQHADHFENTKQYQEQSSGFSGREYSQAHSGRDFSDFFESMFGGSTNTGRSRQVKFRGEDYYAKFQLKLTDAYKPHQQTLSVNGKNIRITIPAGIENGQTIKISAHGGTGINGGPNGDLYITFSIAIHPGIKRLGNDLYTHVDLELYTAVLGGEITIDTLSGKVKLKVKAETQNGSKVKLKGKGFPVYKKEGQFGDLYITYVIKIPTHLTEKQKGLFAELSKS